MYIILYGIIFLVYAILPFWLQMVLFIASWFIAPGGNLILVVAMIAGAVIKARMK